MRRPRQRAFVRCVCFLLAALLLVMALGAQIRLRAVEREAEELLRERETLERENGILRARIAARLSLAELERRAEEDLGMRRCRGDQIVKIGIEEEKAA